jgi:hypothetical protein
MTVTFPAPPLGVIGSELDAVWSDNVGGLPSIGGPFVIGINDRLYLEDLEFKPWKRQAMRFTTVTTTRTQADTSNEPGEQSLSTESLWRRTQDSWHLGADQTFLDRKGSSEFQFRSSKGINPWTQWQLRLLMDTRLGLASTNTNLALVVCNTHLYAIDGQALKYSSDGITWTTVTGTPAVVASSICSDGHTVYVAYGASGIWTSTEGAATATSYVTGTLSPGAVIRYVNGRLMVGSANVIYNVIAAGALPVPLFTSNYANGVWTDFSDGLGCIVASLVSGDKSVIYCITISSDGTTLAPPVVAGAVPYGETISALGGYIGGTIAIGTNLGFRFAEQSSTTTGALAIGPLIRIPSPVACFSPYDRFIWFGWSNYDGVSTGLGRMDPSQFTADLTPAVASDMMAAGQGNVTSVVHFKGTPVFCVAGTGIFVQAPNFVGSGTILSGLITYGLADNKMPVFLDLTTQPLVAGSITSAVAYNGGAFQRAGTMSQVGTTFAEFTLPQQLCETIEIQETLTSGSGGTVSPILTRHTLRSVPAPAVPTDLFVVIQLRERCTIRGVEKPYVPSQEVAYLQGLRDQKQINLVVIGNHGPYQATLEVIDWIPEQVASLTNELNGVAVLNFRTVV